MRVSENLRLYKFYDSKYALDNLRQRRLKVSTLNDLNDPFEFFGFHFRDTTSRRAWEITRNSIFSGKGIICFCQSWDNPLVWSHYADKHFGLAIGFDVPKHVTTIVNYQRELEESPSLTSMTRAERLQVVEKSLCSKFIHWQYENEVRVFVECDEKCPETDLYFKNFETDLKPREVIIGPRSNVTSGELQSIPHMEHINIVHAELAFDSYRVVRQKQA